MIRSGDEPVHARSALRMRLVLAVLGIVVAGAIGVWAWASGWGQGVIIAAVALVGACVNAVIVAIRLRAGPHFQPRSDVPAYRPADPGAPSSSARDRAPQRVRRRWYLALMGVCLGLITLAWLVVRLFSVPLALGMSLVAMVIPPIAAIVANAGGDHNP